jgi:hypothetical protein
MAKSRAGTARLPRCPRGKNRWWRRRRLDRDAIALAADAPALKTVNRRW